MPTFAEFFERYHLEVVLRHHGEKTGENSHYHAQYAVRHFGSTALDQLSTEQLTKDMNWLLDHGGRVTKAHPQGKPLSPTTVRHIAFGVQACLEQAVDWEIIPKNPMKKVRKPKRLKREPAVVDPGGFDRLLDQTAGTALYAPIVLDHATGMRRGELCALEWTDLDWERGKLSVSKSLGQRKTGSVYIKSTKSTKPRRFTIPADVLEILRLPEPEPDLCPPRRILLLPEAPFHAHLLRHAQGRAERRQPALVTAFAASQMLSEGAPITVVSERPGHASPNVTLAIYAHALPTDDQAVATLWNNAMSGVLEASRKKALARKRG
jgi:integrase